MAVAATFRFSWSLASATHGSLRWSHSEQAAQTQSSHRSSVRHSLHIRGRAVSAGCKDAGIKRKVSGKNSSQIRFSLVIVERIPPW